MFSALETFCLMFNGLYMFTLLTYVHYAPHPSLSPPISPASATSPQLNTPCDLSRFRKRMHCMSRGSLEFPKSRAKRGSEIPELHIFFKWPAPAIIINFEPLSRYLVLGPSERFLKISKCIPYLLGPRSRVRETQPLAVQNLVSPLFVHRPLKFERPSFRKSGDIMEEVKITKREKNRVKNRKNRKSKTDNYEDCPYHI